MFLSYRNQSIDLLDQAPFWPSTFFQVIYFIAITFLDNLGAIYCILRIAILGAKVIIKFH